MIKFFRKIRQNLLSENKFAKYLFYAVGEIILVVIGILIALGINNWNINRLERKTEKNILLDLNVEFKENLKDAQRVYNGNLEIVSAVNKIQENLDNNKLTSKSLDSLIFFVFDWFDYTPRPGASDNLINSGNLNLVQNHELRKLLTLWSGVEDELDDDEQLAIQYSQNIIIPFLALNYPLSNLEPFDYTLEFYNRTDINFKVYDNAIEYDMKTLLQNPVFQSHISAKKIYARHNGAEAFTIMETCQSILDLIDVELNKN